MRDVETFDLKFKAAELAPVRGVRPTTFFPSSQFIWQLPREVFQKRRSLEGIPTGNATLEALRWGLCLELLQSDSFRDARTKEPVSPIQVSYRGWKHFRLYEIDWTRFDFLRLRWIRNKPPHHIVGAGVRIVEEGIDKRNLL